MSVPRGRRLLIHLTSITGYLRKDALAGHITHIADISHNTSLTKDYIIMLLTNALQSEYRDEQLELFCSQIYYCDQPADLQGGDHRISTTLRYPPLPILAALSRSDLGVLEHNHSTPEGREILAKYIELGWEPRRQEWLDLLDRNLRDSKLQEKMDEAFPPLDLSKIPPIQGPVGPAG